MSIVRTEEQREQRRASDRARRDRYRALGLHTSQTAKEMASLSYAHECAGLVTSKKGRSNKLGEKPHGMSDVRWRIEQRRRRAQAYYRLCSDPDRI